VQVAVIRDRVQQLREMDKRREAILKSIREQEKLTPELEQKIDAAETMSLLEDLYLPYKLKRRTKATIAKEKGLTSLADLIFLQESIKLEQEAEKHIDAEKEVNSIEEALQGARDIIAEYVNENAELRKKMRDFFISEGKFISKVMPGKEQEAIKYKDYFDWSEPIKTAPSHRVLAMRRGEKELFLRLDSCPEERGAIALMERMLITAKNTRPSRSNWP